MKNYICVKDLHISIYEDEDSRTPEETYIINTGDVYQLGNMKLNNNSITLIGDKYWLELLPEILKEHFEISQKG